MLLLCILILIGPASSMEEDVRQQLHQMTSRISELEQKVAAISSSYCELSGAGYRCGSCRCVDDYQRYEKYYCDCQNLIPKRDCLAFLHSGQKISGVYRITQNNLRTIKVFCDQTTDGGGWTVILRRMDGSVNFYRNWQAYKEGFGKVQDEFWLGNENIFTMSLQGLYPKGSELRIDMEDFASKKLYVKYGHFQLGNEITGYQIHVGKFTGNTYNGLYYANGMKFSTFDQDHDTHPDASIQCARYYPGGWWYESCHAGLLTGRYYYFDQSWPTSKALCWRKRPDGYDRIKFAEMKIRRKA